MPVRERVCPVTSNRDNESDPAVGYEDVHGFAQVGRASREAASISRYGKGLEVSDSGWRSYANFLGGNGICKQQLSRRCSEADERCVGGIIEGRVAKKGSEREAVGFDDKRGEGGANRSQQSGPAATPRSPRMQRHHKEPVNAELVGHVGTEPRMSSGELAPRLGRQVARPRL